MTREQAEAIYETGEEKELEISIRSEYSGRGMFGKMTYAVSGGEADIREVLAILYIDANKLRWDSMGKYDVVCY